MPEPIEYLKRAQQRQARARRISRADMSTTPAPVARAAAIAYQPRLPGVALPYGGRSRPARQRLRHTAAGRGAARLPFAMPHLRSEPHAGTAVFLPEEFDRIQEQQRAARGRKRRSRLPRRWRYVAIGLPALLLIAAIAIIGPILYEGTRAYQDVFVDSVPHEQPPVVAVINEAGTPVLATATAASEEAIPEWNGTERVTILLMGIDRREDEATRSDTMILVNIDPVAKKAGMLSVPRDMQVMIPGYGRDKINAAYAYGDRDEVPGGGPGLTIRTIEANFGIRINYFAQVDFDGFIEIVDTVGGVTVDVPYSIKDDEYPASGNNYMRVYFSTGWQHMDGARALQYARTRHADSDYARSERQQQVLLALRQQAISLDLLPKARELITAVGDSVRTDLSLDQVLQLARLAADFTPEDITQYSLDSGLIEQELPGEPYFLVPDWDICAELLSDFMGVEVMPPASVVADPDYDVPIRVANGTENPGLAQRVADLLASTGFSNVEVIEADSTLPQGSTRIVDNLNDLSTSLYVAGAIGVGVETIDLPTATAGDTPAQDGIVIVLGDDAPDPAFFSPITIEDEIAPEEAAGDPAAPAGSVGDGTAGSAPEGAIDPVDDTGQ